MTSWLDQSPLLTGLDDDARERLAASHPMTIQNGTVLFRPGDEPSAFTFVIEGRVGVYLTGPNGRELLLYAVTPGETCIQTTLGLLGNEAYLGEAIAETELVVTSIPRATFHGLLAQSEAFRGVVFQSLARRMTHVVEVLERVAFVTIEARLAAALLARCDPAGEIVATHQDLAKAIGTAREVVSRRLEALARKSLVRLERGRIEIADRTALLSLSE